MIRRLLNLSSSLDVRTMMRWLWRASDGVRMRITAICLIGVTRVASSLLIIWLSKVLIDSATNPATPSSRLWTIAGYMAAAMLLELALVQISSYISQLTLARMTNHLTHTIYSTMLRSEEMTDKMHSGDILNRITMDVSKVVTTIVSTLPSIVVMVVQLCAAFWLLCEMSPTLALCALVITPIAIIASKAYIVKMRKVNTQIRNSEGRIHINLQEGLQHRMVVQTLECGPEMSSRLGTLQGELMGGVLSRAHINLYSRITLRLGFIAGYLIAFFWSVMQLHAGTITFGIMTAFIQLVGRIQGPISSLSSTMPSLIGTSTSVDRLRELDANQGEIDADCEMLRGRVGVRLSDVTFAYSPRLPLVLSHFSHDFKPGSKTVLMGETGAGKSTITKIILALLHPQEGTVEIYNDKLSLPVSKSTRCNMVYVPQGNSLLQGTIRDNLLLGNPEATDEELKEVLDIAVANFVYDLPLGLDTMCGELGSELSEGQCQRIAIARALLRNGSVMILDEFNSSLDADTAATLMDRLSAFRPEATVIFISHRAEVAAHCDEVVRIERLNQ